MTKAKFDLGDAVETDGGHFGKVTAVFVNGIIARRFCECYYCDRARKLDGYSNRLHKQEQPIYLVETTNGDSVLSPEDQMNIVPEKALWSSRNLRKYVGGQPVTDGHSRNGTPFA